MQRNSSNRQSGFAEIGILIIALLVMAGVGYYAYQNYQKAQAPSAAVGSVHVQPAVTKLAFASDLAPSGAAQTVSTAFAPNAPAVYAVATVTTVGQKERIEYVRYLDNKFVDNGSMALSKDGSHTATFGWKLKPGAVHPAGTYKVKVYANGKFIRESTYTVK